VWIPSHASAQPAPGLTFRLQADPEEAMAEILTQGFRNVYVSGPIARGDAERFLAFVRLKKLDFAKVVFDSPGGSLYEGMKLGRAIRELGFMTAVDRQSEGRRGPAPICASACAYAYAGGVSRFLDAASGRIGIHQFRSAPGASVSEGDAQLVSGVLVA
jgi:hypothetical protein